MKISKITINNYKSIGKSKNVLNLEEGVTALIGKNESGKSNVLDAISAISFESALKIIDNDKNRITGEDVSYVVEMFVLPEEVKEFELSEKGITTFNIAKDEVIFEGEFSKLFAEDAEVICLANQLQKNIDRYKHRDPVKKLIYYLEGLKERIFFNAVATVSNCRYDITQKVGNLGWPGINDFDQSSEKFLKEIERIYSLLPILYSYKETMLLDSYTAEQVSSIWDGKTPEKSLNIFLRSAKIGKELFRKAIIEENSGQKEDAQDKIKELVEENINKRFNEFYGQNNISVSLMINNGKTVNINVKSSGLRLGFSEQSNGLRWYLNLFLDILSRNLENRSVLFIIDEPGVYLHVDAQSALLKLFEHLTKDKCSLIYTTHSPFMLDSKHSYNIRVIQKIDGLTEIINKYYSDEIDGKSRLETLSPFLKGIGASLSNTIFPLFDKPCLITEGITDKLYIETMLKITGRDESKFYIIPSVGASNIALLVSIFIGWGIEFRVLLDYDKAGFDEYKKLTKESAFCPDKLIHFVNCKNYKEGIEKDEYETIESLISKVDRYKFDMLTEHNVNKPSKYVAANDFHNKVINSEIELSQETKDNFSKLFEALFKD